MSDPKDIAPPVLREADHRAESTDQASPLQTSSVSSAVEKDVAAIEVSQSNRPTAGLDNQDGADTISRARSETIAATISSNDDPLGFSRHKRGNVTTKQLKEDYPKAKPREMKKYYSKQNALIDQFLGSGDEERLAAQDLEENGVKIKIAVYGSFGINLALFVIQLYAAISTGSLSLFATATDAFVSLPLPTRDFEPLIGLVDGPRLLSSDACCFSYGPKAERIQISNWPNSHRDNRHYLVLCFDDHSRGPVDRKHCTVASSPYSL